GPYVGASGFVQLFPRKKLPAVKAEGASSAATQNGSSPDLNAHPSQIRENPISARQQSATSTQIPREKPCAEQANPLSPPL
ncbi:hypothetical protein ACQKO7_23350, partial [Pseudomonas putida]|uniref:hypothetical protein n=1 Tax=Pseudomonas putida TaxID=303 RepID=UPI003D06AC98